MDKLIAVWIPVLSLAVAAIAVFVGPLLSMYVAFRQRLATLEVDNKQILGPMRQAWINTLRELVAELTSSALHYYNAGFEDRTEEEYRRLTLLEHKLILMLNAQETDHQQLEGLVRQLINNLERGKEAEAEFSDLFRSVTDLARQIFKREWNVVKGKIPSD
jgi:hypothetical protein